MFKYAAFSSLSQRCRYTQVKAMITGLEFGTLSARKLLPSSNTSSTVDVCWDIGAESLKNKNSSLYVTVRNVTVCNVRVCNVTVCNVTVRNVTVCNVTVCNVTVRNVRVCNVTVCNVTVRNVRVGKGESCGGILKGRFHCIINTCFNTDGTNIQYILYNNICCTIYIVQYILYNIYYTVYTVQQWFPTFFILFPPFINVDY